MKNLILIRHAKSSWDKPVSDKDRELTERGKNDAILVSKESRVLLDDHFVLFSSNARRALETATIFATNYSLPLNEIIVNEDLYTYNLLRSTNMKYTSKYIFVPRSTICTLTYLFVLRCTHFLNSQSKHSSLEPLFLQIYS